MTNNDNVAGLCERLRGMGWKRLGEPLASEVEVEITNAADTLERQAAEIGKLREVLEELIDHADQCLARLDYHDLLMMGDEPIKEARAALTGERWLGRALACAALVS